MKTTTQQFKKGDKVIRNGEQLGSGNAALSGTEYVVRTVTRYTGYKDPYYQGKSMEFKVGLNNPGRNTSAGWAYDGELVKQYGTRAEKADYLEGSVKNKVKLQKELSKEISEINIEIVNLRKYPDKATEVAHTIARISKKGDDIAGIAKVLIESGLVKEEL